MTTRQRFRDGRFRLELRERDHGPPHVHVVGGEFDVLVELGTLKSTGRWPRGLREEVLEWIARHHDELMEEWQRWHP